MRRAVAWPDGLPGGHPDSPPPAHASIELTVDADHDPDQVDALELAFAHEDRLHAAVGRLQANHVALRIVALDGCLVGDHRDHDVAALGRELLAHENEVSVVDAVL